MRRFLALILLLPLLIIPVSGTEIEPPEVPESGEIYMPEDTESFGEAVWQIMITATEHLWSEIKIASSTSFSILAILLLVSFLSTVSTQAGSAVHLAGVLLIGLLLLSPAQSLITLGLNTVRELTDYGKLLLPVLTTALAAQGGIQSSVTIYVGTTLFSSVLSTIIHAVITPLLHIFLCICLLKSIIDEDIISKISKFIKWLITWSLKISLYVFLGYISISGVISGTADASAVRAVKLTISGMVPIVGGIISEASETILVSTGIVKNMAGVYGALAIIAVFIGPFLKIGVQYMLLKITAALSGVFDTKQEANLLNDYSSAMGMLLAMTGTVSLFLLVGVICAMKGMT